MEYYIRRVQIEGLFEKNNNYKIDLSQGCNCIFGGNGTGKTTIINLIVNSLNCDLNSIAKVPFDKLTIQLAKAGQVRPRKFFSVTREPNIDSSIYNEVNLNYVVEEKPYNFEINTRNSAKNLNELDEKKIEELKTNLLSKVNLTHVPLLRIHDSDLFSNASDSDYFLQTALRHKQVSRHQIAEIMDTSVRGLNNLQDQFVSAANETRKGITEKLEILKSQIIEKVMIDRKLASQSGKAFSKVSRALNTEAENVDVTAYVNKLDGANINVPEEKVYEHFDTWKHLNSNVKKDFENMTRTQKDETSTDDQKMKAGEKFNASYFGLLALAHLHDRFLSIVDDVESMQKEKEELTKSFRDYEEEVNKYLAGRKEFSLSEGGKFHVNSGERVIELADLSSGEKHILTILGRAALSSNDGAVFVADEPELSLHLDWQRMILPSIIKLSPKSQIIVATHSPAIHAPGAHEVDLEESV